MITGAAQQFTDGPGGELAVVVHQMPADVGALHPAAEALAFVRRDLVPMLQLLAADGPFFFVIPDAQVGVEAGGDAALAIVEADQPRGIAR